jgi:hypothetical protein
MEAWTAKWEGRGEREGRSNFKPGGYWVPRLIGDKRLRFGCDFQYEISIRNHR